MKKLGLRKKKKPAHKIYRALYKKAEEVFHRWIRERDRSKGCITCFKPVTEAGHFKHNRLDFDERNLNGQCSGCNRWLSGRLDVYALRLIEMYGLEAVKDLERRAALYAKPTKAELEEIIKKYEEVSKL